MHTDQIQRVAHRGNADRAERRIDHRARAAEHARTAQNAGCDTVELIVVALRRVYGRQLCAQKKTRDSREESGNHIHGEQNILGIQSLHPHDAFIVAERIDPVAEFAS